MTSTLYDVPSPSPAPTGGAAVPDAWTCLPTYATAPDGTYQQTEQDCAVTGWQVQPTPPVATSTASSAVTVTGASEDVEYSYAVAIFLLAALVVMAMAQLVRSGN